MANTRWNSADRSANIALTGSDLIATCTSGVQGGVRAVDKQVLNKFYWECTWNVATGGGAGVGLANSLLVLSNAPTGSTLIGLCALMRNGSVYVDGSIAASGFGVISSGAVICIAVDLTARLIWFRIGGGGNWNTVASNNPATGVGGIVLGALGNAIPAYPTAWINTLNDQITANFGDTAFTGAVPSGYTSGFTAGASVPTNALASQALAEHWLTTDPDARITQVVAEHWTSVASGNLQAVVTFVALEHWTSVAVVVPAAGGPMVTMIH